MTSALLQRSNTRVLLIALWCVMLASLAGGQQNTKPDLSPAEIQQLRDVGALVSSAWSSLHDGKPDEVQKALSLLRQTPKAPHTDVRGFAFEMADMVEARVEMTRGDYNRAASIFERHLRLNANAHRKTGDAFFMAGGVNSDLQIGGSTGGQCFRLADYAVCLARLQRYDAALRIYWTGLRTLWDGSKLERVSEPVPLVETFDRGLTSVNAPRFEAACYLMASVSTQQNGNEEWMAGYVKRAAEADPTWELAQFYAAYLPLQFVNFRTGRDRRAAYDKGMSSCSTLTYRDLLRSAVNYRKVAPLASGADQRGSSATLLKDLQRVRLLSTKEALGKGLRLSE